MEAVSFDGYQYIKEACLKAFKENEVIAPADLATALMRHPEMPMHYPFHHFLVPAVMLTTVFKVNKMDVAELEEALEQALERSRNVLPGFCGFYGDCGAAVGLGIFMSILTGTRPVSEESWGTCNRITAGSLMKMAEIGGPRCCKRNTYLAIEYAITFMKAHFDTVLPAPDRIVCEFYDRNNECKKEKCPYYQEKIQ